MKGKIMLIILLFLILLLVPLFSLGGKTIVKPSSAVPAAASRSVAASSSPPSPSSGAASSASKKSEPETSAPAAVKTGAGFKIYDSSSGKVISVADREFLYGAIAAEMSPAAPAEALKAQGVAAYTYYSRLRQQQRLKPDSSLKGADFSADTKKWQIYVTKEQMQARWGGSFSTNHSMLTKAADAVCGQVLKCGGELIDATYFAISSGQTESAEAMWGGKRSYLVSVASPGDAFASGFQTGVTLTADQFKAAALKAAPKANLTGDAAKWVGAAVRTAAGSVESIKIGGASLTGTAARGAFGLRSANFTVSYANGKFNFTVKGYGHGVGMSQVGAQFMANQGSDYKQILSWYYPGTALGTL